MEEQKLVERPLMTEKEFKNYMEENRVDIVGDFYEKNILHLRNFEAVKRFRSIRRAIRRGHISIFGDIYPNRPFNNRATKFNEQRKRIYGELKQRQIVGL